MNFKLVTLPQAVLSLFLAITLLIIGYFGSECHAQEDRLRIHFIDVGYGDAILVQLPDSSTLMIDAGKESNAPQLVSYLQSLEIQDIDQAVITHPHKNHFEGFFDILKYIPVQQLYVNGDQNAEEGYDRLLEIFHAKQIPTLHLSRRMKISGLPETVDIEVLHPENLSSTANGNSIVLWLKHGKVSVLLMADIEMKEQTELIGSYPEIIQADHIKIPHHGGPVSDEFIQAFKGKSFIISTGPNPWGLPHEDDMQRLQGTVYRTDHQGTIILESDGVSTSIQTAGIKGD